MIFFRRPLTALRLPSLPAVAACAALLVASCSVDSKGFGGGDAGLGGSTSATGGATAGGGTPGSGGAAGAGGVPGNGGSPASGGSPGSGGHGSGGKSGSGGSGGRASGGTSGSGGSGAAGGHIGAGGGGGESSGTGGKSMGSGGAGGKAGMGGGDAAGQGGAPAETCDQLATEYATALDQARTCDPSAAGQCQQTAAATLSYCNTCPLVPVNDSTRLTAIRAQWLAQGCPPPSACPAIACVLPSPATCTATDAAAPGGRCESSGITN